MTGFDLQVTYEDLLARKMSGLPTQDKRETSMIYQATAANSLETAQMLYTLFNYENLIFADTAPRELLIRRAAERGLVPHPATHAIRLGQFNMDVPIGSRFSLNELDYVVTEQVSSGQFKLMCETAGEVGNFESGPLIPIDYINGLTNALLVDVLIPGEEEEDTEAFRKRYFDSFMSITFAGNRAHYKEFVSAMPGVGGVRVYRAKYGPGTVGLTIIDSAFNKPSNELIATLQELIDPLEEQGEGVGLAPLDHIVTVSPVCETVVNISLNLTLDGTWTFDDVKQRVEQVVDDYFKSLAREWVAATTKQDDETGLTVRVSQLETRILGIPGVIDIADTTLNGVAGNLEIDKESIPKRGVISG